MNDQQAVMPPPDLSAAARRASRARWDAPHYQAARRQARDRKIAALLARFPVTPDEAEAIRAMLPPPTAERGGEGE